MSHDDIPSFAIIRDLFDFFDIRKDGVVDLHEWMQTFKILEEYTYLPQKSAPKITFHTVTPAIFSTNTLHLTKWGQSPEYEAILRFIGKNRKVIIETLVELQKQNVPLTFERVKTLLGDMLLKANLNVPDKNWPLLLKFAEKDGAIDFRFMMEVFKERLDIILSHPKEKI